jgi:hypothetical protein
MYMSCNLFFPSPGARGMCLGTTHPVNAPCLPAQHELCCSTAIHEADGDDMLQAEMEREVDMAARLDRGRK